MALGLANLRPLAVIALLTLWAVLALIASTTLKLFAFAAILRQTAHRSRQDHKKRPDPAPEMKAGPVISVMVPLFAEADIADKLIGRLSRLDYPRELMDILLVAEETDRVTCQALEDASLPRWMRVIKAPTGPIRTKPRALNYALNFCRARSSSASGMPRTGPNRTSCTRSRAAFTSRPDVACLQGVLDYNPAHQLAGPRFTIEYASWFRATLAGCRAALDLVVPLGGTTLFFRRDLLERVGGWDAWNVTEDADLGVRLTRRAIAPGCWTPSPRRANCRLVPLVEAALALAQGLRDDLGVHMRNLYWRCGATTRHAALSGASGRRRFLVSHLLAPVQWSFWLLPRTCRAPCRGDDGRHAITGAVRPVHPGRGPEYRRRHLGRARTRPPAPAGMGADAASLFPAGLPLPRGRRSMRWSRGPSAGTRPARRL